MCLLTAARGGGKSQDQRTTKVLTNTPEAAARKAGGGSTDGNKVGSSMKDEAGGQPPGQGREDARDPVLDPEIRKSRGLNSERRQGLGPGLVPGKGDHGLDPAHGIRGGHGLDQVQGRSEGLLGIGKNEDQELDRDPKREGNQGLDQGLVRGQGTGVGHGLERGAHSQSGKPQKSKGDGFFLRRK